MFNVLVVFGITMLVLIVLTRILVASIKDEFETIEKKIIQLKLKEDIGEKNDEI